MTAPALVALAHGSRDPRSARTLSELVRVIEREHPGLSVKVAFLDFNTPDLGSVTGDLVSRGHREVRVVPLFLTSAYHMRVDVPDALSEVGKEHPRVDLRLGEAVGADPTLLAILDQRVREAVRREPGEEPDALVMASAGSSNPQANAAIARLAQEWGARRHLPAIAAFASSTGPSTAEAVRELQRRGHRRVAVGSLFFAPGRLPDRVTELAIETGAAVVSAPLGAHAQLARLIVNRYVAATLERAAA